MPFAKTKALISFAVTAKLICTFVFAYAKCWFSHGLADLSCKSFGLCIHAWYIIITVLKLTFKMSTYNLRI